MRTLIPLLALLAVTVAACGDSAAAGECEEVIAGVRPGVCLLDASERQPAPDLAMPVLGSEEELSLADLRGQPVVLNFWASWCGPCRAEQPDLNAAYEALSDTDVAFLGVNIQEPGPAEANALAHEREFDMPYPSLYDPSNLYSSRFEGVGPRSVPSTLFIDRQGRVAARIFGQLRGPQEVVALAERLSFESP